MYSRLSSTSDLEKCVLPGVPFDYLNTPIYDQGLRELIGQSNVLQDLMNDRDPLPTTAAREGYFGDRHLEFWLSGYRDAQAVIQACGSSLKPEPWILDFGGASGRVVRHFHNRRSGGELFLSDINPQHIALTQLLFGGQIKAVRGRGIPSLPFPDRSFDLVFAFSVFTHIDSEDTAWLLELRRIVRPGGCVYLTIHDEVTWEQLPSLSAMGGALASPELAQMRTEHPALRDKIVHFYSPEEDYNCNVFAPESYLNRVWKPLFASCQKLSTRHDHQGAVLLQVS